LRGESDMVLALDRGQQAVVGLDANLYECLRWSLPNPIDAAFLSTVHWAIAYLPVDKDVAPLSRIAWIDRGAMIREQVWPGVLALAPGECGQSLWVLHARGVNPGVLSRLGLDGETLESHAVDYARSLLPCPDAGGLWVVDPGGHIAFGRDSGGRLTVSSRLQLPAPVLASRVVGPYLWVRLDERGRGWIRLSSVHLNGQDGALRVRSERRHAPWKPAALLERRRFPSPAQQAWVEASLIERLPNGGWLIAAPEFLWRLGSDGEPICGQGGFNHLSRISWFDAFERPGRSPRAAIR